MYIHKDKSHDLELHKMKNSIDKWNKELLVFTKTNIRML